MDVFKLKFWGCTGSIPSPLSTFDLYNRISEVLCFAIEKGLNDKELIGKFIDELPFYLRGTYHGNTPCIEIIDNDDRNYIIFDAGSGIRPLGQSLMNRIAPHSHIHIFMSHYHWDHIQGFPFFVPIYNKSTRVTIYGSHPDFEESFKKQFTKSNFPVSFSNLQAIIDFKYLEPDKDFVVGNYIIKSHLVPHPGGSYSYKLMRDNVSIVYATDIEIKNFNSNYIEEYINFFKDSKFLIYDSMYTVPENVMKEDWGHSSVIIGIDLAIQANIKNIIIFHHEPSYSDKEIEDIYKSAILYKNMRTKGKNVNVITSYDGLEIDILE